MYVLLAFIAYVIGSGVYLADLKCFTGRYVCTIKLPQYHSLILFLLAISVIIVEGIYVSNVISIIEDSIFALTLYSVFEWMLAKFHLHNYNIVLSCRVLVILFFALYLFSSISAFLICGLFFRNSPFGVVFPIWPSYGFEGRLSGKSLNLQSMIDEVSQNGGGIVHIPAGRYIIEGNIQINHSNISIVGETDEQGNPQTELICKTNLVNGSSNPWISPFFITTGEELQPSNIFWGLDFRKKKQIRIESSSLSDPGGDGTILTPEYVTNVIVDAKKGDYLLKVDDSTHIGKYILLGMYNTSVDGNLLKDILGVSSFRPEWVMANRAGLEEAPSFQWLVKVKSILDAHTIELSSPLLRDCLVIYSPVIFNATMLENINISNLKLSSTWNGLFHHHGLPLYYSVRQAQEMDYGWNGINLKRVANGIIENVVIENFTNPLYIMDSCDCLCNNISIQGFAGHQGLKVYCHSSRNKFNNIRFFTSFADMMGGEGNAYDNTFQNISYNNQHFVPVDFDFHGFSEGPMSPPAYNKFYHISGFRFIKGAGAVSHIPSCARYNEWHDIQWSGGHKYDTNRYYMMPYRCKGFIEKYISAVGYTLVIMLKRRCFSPSFFIMTLRKKVQNINSMGINRQKHSQFFPDNRVYN